MAIDLEQGFGAVLAAPDDDAPRRALAQLYRGAGDPRGDFIEGQLRLAGLPPWHPERPALAREVQAILDRHGDDWRADLGCTQLRVSYQRGLPYCASGTPADLRAELAVLVERAPIVALDLEVDEEDTGPDPDLEPLVELDALERLRHLRLHEIDVRPSALARLLSHPVWERLEVAELGSGACETELLTALAATSLPAALRELRCVGHMGGMGDEGLRALAGADWLGRLERLELCGQGLTDAGLAHLAAAGLTLRHLDLASVGYGANDLSADALAELAKRPWFAGLRVLGLNGCALAGGIPPALAHATELTGANLGRTGLDDDRLGFISQMPVWSRLEELTLSANPLGDDGARTLAECSRLPAVLALSACKIGARGLEHLGRAPQVSALDLRGNPIDAGAWAAALAAGRLPRATALAADARDWSAELIEGVRAYYPRADLST